VANVSFEALTARLSRYSLLGYGSVAVALLAFASFTVAFFLPIYTDEIVWKAYQDRMWYDGFQSTGSFLTCGAHSFRTPLLLAPFRLLDTAVYEELDQPLGIRAIGVGLALAWGFITWLLLRCSVGRTISPGTIATGVIAFSTVGIMPFLLVLNRPEQVLLIAITLLTIPLLQDESPTKRSLPTEIAAALGFVFFCGYVLAAHQLGILTIPLMLLFLVRFFPRKSIVGLSAVAVVVIGVTAFLDWNRRWQCGDPSLKLTFFKDNIMFAVQSGELRHYLRMWLELLWTDFAPFSYLSEFLFKRHYTSPLLPGAPDIVRISLSMGIFVLFAFILSVGACAFGLLMRNSVRTRRGVVPLLTLGWIWGFYIFAVFARLVRNEYQAELIEPVMVLMALASLWLARGLIVGRFGASRSLMVARGTFAALIGLSILSQLALLAIYTPYAFGSWSDPGYPSELKYSISGFGYERLRPKILETAALCDIDPNRHPQHVVVDELTYFALEPAYQPFFATYLHESNWGENISDIRGLLDSWNSAGMIVGCQWVPHKLRSEAIENGQFCCLRKFAR